MKNILILGAYGFLGTNIIKYIDKHLAGEYRVITFDRFGRHPAGVSFGSITRSYAGDLSDGKLMDGIFESNRIDIVIHCISTTIPSDSFNARFDIESNLIPTVGLLECMVKHKVSDIVYLSSGGAIYGNANEGRHKETDDVFPISSYGVVKLAIEKYLMQYAQLFGLRPLICRLSNPYGPWHYSMRQGICNVAIAKALSGETFQIWGDGNGQKDYIFVEDFVKILFKLVSLGIHSEVLNVGSGDCHSVGEILGEIKLLMPSFEWKHIEASRLDVSRFSLDTGKLHSIIGGFEFTPLRKGLAKTFEWTKEHA